MITVEMSFIKAADSVTMRVDQTMQSMALILQSDIFTLIVFILNSSFNDDGRVLILQLHGYTTLTLAFIW